ncbi:MAG: ABC transporter permease [Bacteroidota bacterium]
MSKTLTEKPKTPFYYVKKRLTANIPAIFGLVIISIAILVAIFGYLIMPDPTPNANDGDVAIAKKPVGFSVQLLKERKHTSILQTNIFKKMLFGQESIYKITPITSYRIKGYTIHYKMYGREDKTFTAHLINVVKPIFIGEQDLLPNPNASGNFSINGDQVQYVDIDGTLQTTTRVALEEEFQTSHIEERLFVLGTDKMGRDMLSRLILGTRISLGIGFVAVLISLVVGITLGSIAGFFGGVIDSFVMWFMTVVWSIPGIMLVIAISLALSDRGIWVAFVAVGLTTWVEIARVVRGQIMEIKQKQFIEAAKALGARNFNIIARHIFPNLLGSLIVIISANFASAILIEAGLSFLGLGVQPPTPSWGMMVNEGFELIGSKGHFHMIFYPSLCISLMVLAFNLLGNGLRDAYDPKTIIK